MRKYKIPQNFTFSHFIYQQTNELRCGNKENGESFSTFSVSVPRPGIEPGWVSPLVFETSASTYSAIWAPDFSFASAKVMRFFISAKEFVFFLKKSFNCLSIPLESSNFASRLLSAHGMGMQCFRSLSLLK